MSSLFEPVTFRSGATSSNRVALAPLTNQQSHDDGTLGDEELAWLARRAEGGFGLVSTCAAHVAADGQGFPGQLGVFDDRHVDGLARVAARIRAAGALGVVQLHHAGARSPARLTGVQPVSATAFREEREGFEPPRQATAADLARFIDAFGAAAARCLRAGFHGVEIHGAHGYLLSQFLSATMNTRDDGWGGDLAGRARLLREVARRVRAELPAPALVGVRLSPEDYGLARGLDVDETVEVARQLADDGVDYVHLSLWDGAKNTSKHPEQHAVTLVRRALPAEVKILAAGGVWTVADAQALLARGADVVAIGRAAILDPDWPRHAAQPGFEPERGPLTPEQLVARAVSPRFVEYLRRFRGLVSA